MDGKTGKPMLDGIGATELLHIFISNRFGAATRPDRHTGQRLRGRSWYDDMNEVPRGTGRAVWPSKGPTGCRYLIDDRQQIMCAMAGT